MSQLEIVRIPRKSLSLGCPVDELMFEHSLACSPALDDIEEFSLFILVDNKSIVVFEEIPDLAFCQAVRIYVQLSLEYLIPDGRCVCDDICPGGYQAHARWNLRVALYPEQAWTRGSENLGNVDFEVSPPGRLANAVEIVVTLTEVLEAGLADARRLLVVLPREDEYDLLEPLSHGLAVVLREYVCEEHG